jgi:death-on-curing protein
MKTLSPEQVLFIHARLVAETGGIHGIRDLGLLESAVARPQATFNGLELYPNLFLKAAALLDSLINNHPFADGNQRTGITSAALLLKINRYHLTATNAELESFTLQVATYHLPLPEIAAWFGRYAVPD